MESIRKSPNADTPGWFKIGPTLPSILRKEIDQDLDDPVKWWVAVPSDGGYKSVGSDLVTEDGSENSKTVFTENAFTINGISYNMYARKTATYTTSQAFKKTK